MPTPWSDTADIAACRALLRHGSRSFHAASHLLPRRVFEPAAALYAFCRLADDCIDTEGGTVASLRARLQCAYAGLPMDFAADRAFARVVSVHAIPIALPEALLEGFAWDAQGRRYNDLPALLDYAARVAGSVGAMMAMLMGVRDPDILARACDLGTAMQLSNIARDVGEDAQAGRLYLPLQWLRDGGIDRDAFLAAPVFTPALGAIVQRLLDAADRLYGSADAGIGGLPWACRPGIGAARYLYAEIGQMVRRRGGDSVSMRAHVPPARKAALLGRAILASCPALRPGTYPATTEAPLAACAYLVDAARHAPPPLPARAAARSALPRPVSPRRASLDARAAWLVELFARLSDSQQREA
jgi:phytoene synthase